MSGTDTEPLRTFTHPSHYTENFGRDYHGPELKNRPKSSVVIAAEDCVEDTPVFNEEHAIHATLRMEPRRELGLSHRRVPYVAGNVVR